MTLPHTLQNGPGNALDADQLMDNFEYASSGLYRRRNRIVNGAMEFDQRNEGTAYTVSTAATNRTLDCWYGYGQASDGVFTVQRLTTSPPAGFTHYQQFKTTTADASIAAGQLYLVGHQLEGTRMRDLLFGSAAAKTVI